MRASPAECNSALRRDQASLLRGAICPYAEPFGLTFYTASETLAVPGRRACCKLLVLVKGVLFGRRPCGRLLPTTSRRSTWAALPAFHYPLSIIHYPLSIIHYSLSIIHYHLSIPLHLNLQLEHDLLL